MINYVTGDATRPQGKGLKVIIHVCNDIGAWGAGFVLALSNRWQEPERMYHAWFVPSKENVPIESRLDHGWLYGYGYTDSLKPSLGEIQEVPVILSDSQEPDADAIIVYNLIAQRGLISKENPIPLDYEALEKCLNKVAKCIGDWKGDVLGPRMVSVHAPRFGAGLAGGDWNKIEALIQKCLVDKDISVTIYDWKG